MGAVLVELLRGAARSCWTSSHDFHKSKKLREHIIHINTLEEQADKLFIDSLRTVCTPLHQDPLEVISLAGDLHLPGEMRRCL